jgi:hypothetical protein
MSDRTSGPNSSSAIDSMRFMLLVGLILQVIGCGIAVFAVPELTDAGGLEGGDRALMLIALLAFGLGGVLSLVSVVAYGVLLGMRAHQQGS